MITWAKPSSYPSCNQRNKDRIYAAGEGVNVLITEIGGTIGDIEGLPFTEAMRQFATEVGKANVLFIHMTSSSQSSGCRRIEN